ncbi:MAG: heavy-metal-associated domain-containing protein [Flavobacteriaceae bacterium]
MKQHVQVLGMTCQNCRRKVEEKIASIDGITAVEVNLEKAEACFTAAQIISLDHLGIVLGEKYQLSPIGEVKGIITSSKWKELKPLFLIFGYIIVASIGLSKAASVSLFMRYFMGLFYVVFGFFKFLDFKGFPASFRQYDPIAKRFSFYAWLYPFIETVLGIAFLLEYQLQIGLWVTLLILGSTTIGVVQQLRKKTSIQCACLGTALNLPMTEATLIENTIMLGMAVGMLLATV